LYYTTFQSNLGEIIIAAHDGGLTHIAFQDGAQPVQPQPGWQLDEEPFKEAIQQLTEYFNGQRKTFNLNLAPKGTAFQTKVWSLLQEIPFGKVISYGQLAEQAGNPRASRAVGAANGRNPLPVVIPCHRVIGGNGKLTGYAGGLAIKEKLLQLEQVKL